MVLPSWAGPSEGGDVRIADRSTGSTEVTLALYF